MGKFKVSQKGKIDTKPDFNPEVAHAHGYATLKAARYLLEQTCQPQAAAADYHMESALAAQAAEVFIKAALKNLNVDYPKTHNIRHLFHLLPKTTKKRFLNRFYLEKASHRPWQLHYFLFNLKQSAFNVENLRYSYELSGSYANSMFFGINFAEEMGLFVQERLFTAEKRTKVFYTHDRPVLDPHAQGSVEETIKQLNLLTRTVLI